MSRRPGYGRAVLVALAAVALDQLAKALVRGSLAPGERVTLVGGTDLVRVANRGIAFGLLDDAGALVIVLAAGAFGALLIVFLSASDRGGLWLPIGLLAGGAIGNLIDRVREGAVTDFIDLGPWPAFNLADVEITLGVVILVWMYAFGTGAEPDPGDGGHGQDRRPARAGPGSG